MHKEYEIFEDFLKTKNLKLTKQRSEVLKYFLKIEKHLSVEDLYDTIKKNNPSIGHATVFRTIKLLCEADIAREVNFADKIIRYEHKYGHEHHDHLTCLKCGKFVEAMDPKIEELQIKLCEQFGFIPQRHRMEIFGICEKCSKQKK